MKYALTIGFPRGKNPEPVVIAGPGVPVAEQKERFKKMLTERQNEDFERIEMVDSARGRIRKAKFLTGAELKQREKARADQEKAHQEAQEAANSGDAPAAEAGKPKAEAKAEKPKAKPKAAKAEKETLNPA